MGKRFGRDDAHSRAQELQLAGRFQKMDAIRIRVPLELAETLVAEGEAVRPYTTRGAGLSESVTFAIEGVNTAAAVVTLVGSVQAYRRFARRLRARARGRQVVAETDDGRVQLPDDQNPDRAGPASDTRGLEIDEAQWDDAVVVILMGARPSPRDDG